MVSMDEYFKKLKDVYSYFGFQEGSVVYPLEDYREHHWKIEYDEMVLFGEDNDVYNETGNHYENAIHKQRFYDKWIYRGEKYTMIFVDTQLNGNKFFGVFDNSKEIIS